MSARLDKLRVLIVEDDYYLATDTQAALEAAGAEVLGPYADMQSALDNLDRGAPHAAVLDVNLGSGSCFEVAKALSERNTPYVFVTGYDAAAMPAAFRSIPRLEKPFDARDLVEALKGVARPRDA